MNQSVIAVPANIMAADNIVWLRDSTSYYHYQQYCLTPADT